MAASDLFDGPVRGDGAARFLAAAGHAIWLATAPDGTAVGFVSSIETHHPDKDPELFVHELGVDRAWRRLGVATALMQAVVDHAVDVGCRGVWTATESDNTAAIATYRSLGFGLDADPVIVELPLS